MIVPSKNQKTYGVIHTENYFSFLGFCKKVNSDKIQKVDIFVNDTLIDTIVADKHIEIIEDIYELEGFGFNYILPNEYIGQKKISFKNHETKEDLQNSPYELIDETHPRFNEMAFLNSLSNSVEEKEKKNVFNPNCIGFMATEMNLNSKDFIKYIKELSSYFQGYPIKGFYFNESQKNLINKTFNSIECIQISSIYDLAKEIEIFIWDLNDSLDLKIVRTFINTFNNIFFTYNFYNPYFIDLKDKSLLDLDNFYEERNELILRNPEKVGFTNEEISLNKNSYHKLIYNSLISRELKTNFEIDLNSSALEFLLFKQIEFALIYKDFKKDFIKMHKLRNDYLC